jgi:hypothetical protein
MILSASRRTDIPTYHGEWFMNRLREGYVLTRNPMNHSQIHRLPLSPDVVDCIVFWTKNATCTVCGATGAEKIDGTLVTESYYSDYSASIMLKSEK